MKTLGAILAGIVTFFLAIALYLVYFVVCVGVVVGAVWVVFKIFGIDIEGFTA